ncbi:ankyrin repeat domain-containing protein [Hydrogenophaga sp.]|uniref:ankyrin repeat domain-containing protein n=1 Tax=Hydrogenophaga sp. TaxID=1904254 RepID=UPI003F6F2F00
MTNPSEKLQDAAAAAVVNREHQKLFSLLVDAGLDQMPALANHIYPGNRSLTTLAAEKSDPDMLAILGEVMNLSQRDAYGWRPLDVAVKDGKEEMVSALVDRGGSQMLDEHSASGETVAHVAARAGDARMVKLLLELGANLSVPSDTGEVPAHAAAWEGHRQVIEVMPVEALSSKSEKGDTPALMAAMRGHAGVLEALALQGANLTQPDREGNTPLHHAAALGDVDSIKVLLTRAPDSVLAGNQHGQTPAAVAPPNSGAAKLLTELGAKGLNWKQLLDNAAVVRPAAVTPAAVTSAIPGKPRHSLR